MIVKKIILAIFLSLLVLLGFWYARNQTAKNIVSGVVSNPSDNLKSDAGITNIILMGIRGDNQIGGDLTDSMLLLSLNLGSKTAKIIPIPRDVWVPSLKTKINAAYHYGNSMREGGGRDLAKSAVAETLGVPVHYALVLDFQSFVKSIDAIGGVDVYVKNTFDDYKYPIPGRETAEPESSRYEHIHFDSGQMHMDGATALKFARSRHALGEEGTDFARAARQQNIILAFRSKLFSKEIIFNSDAMTKLRESVVSSIDTDISQVEQGSFLKVFLGLGNKNDVTSIVLTDYLTTPKNTKIYGGQWVLVPNPSLEALQAYVKTELAK